MVKKIGIGVVVLAVMVLIISLQPSVFRISRAGEIQAPPEAVFAILNDLHQGARWSPFEQIDPKMKRTFSGPETGPGSSYSWEGNSEAGAGTMTIEESRPHELIRMKLDFTRPMTATNEVRYELAPTANGTQVTWIMEGKNSFVGKAACMFMNMDEMIGSVFEEGLTKLNELAISSGEAKTK